MEQLKTLNTDILLAERWIRKRKADIGWRTTYIAGTHSVVHVVWGARQRFWGLLPPKALPRTVTKLRLPEDVLTKNQLVRYLQRKQPGWL